MRQHVRPKYRQYSLLQQGDNTDKQEQWKTGTFVPANVTKAYRWRSGCSFILNTGAT